MSTTSEIIDSLALLDRDIDSAEIELQAELTALMQTTVNRRFAPLKKRVHHMRVMVNRFVQSTGDSATNCAHENNAFQQGNGSTENKQADALASMLWRYFNSHVVDRDTQFWV